MMKWLKICLLRRQRETKCRQESLGVGRDILKFSLHSPTTLLLNHVVPPGISSVVLSRIIQNHPDHVFDRAIVSSDKVWRTPTLFASIISVSFLWNMAHYPLQIKRLPGPVTRMKGSQRPPSMAINTTTTLDSFGLLDPSFWFFRKHKSLAGGKISEFERKSFTLQNSPDSKVFGFKVPTLKFRIQNLLRHDQTGDVFISDSSTCVQTAKPIRY